MDYKSSITVTVQDEDGWGLPEATVRVESDQTLRRRWAITDEEGVAYLVEFDPAFNYVVTVTLDGFNGERFEDVRVLADRDTPLSATLSLQIISEE